MKGSTRYFKLYHSDKPLNDADFIDTFRLNNWHNPFHYLPAQFCTTKASFQSDVTLKTSLAP